MNATNTLTSEHVLDRPKRYSPAIYRRAAEILIERMEDYGVEVEDSDPADVLRDIESVMHTHGGYERARDLENRGWMPDRNLVEWLDDDTTHDAHREAVKAWVRSEGITAALALGTNVTVSHPRYLDGSPATGTIYKINSDDATYVIRVPAWGHVPEGQTGTQGTILTFEEVEAMKRSESATPVGAVDPQGGSTPV